MEGGRPAWRKEIACEMDRKEGEIGEGTREKWGEREEGREGQTA